MLASGESVSGRLIGERLAVSRTSVSNWVSQLGSYGLEVHRSRGAGYRLEHPIDLLSDGLPACFELDEPRVSSIELLDSVDSTNRHAMESLQGALGARVAASGASNRRSSFMLVLAEHQAAGRGRRGRQWVSPFGRNIYLSLAFRIFSPLQALSGLSLLIGIASARTLRRFGFAGPGLKWPNDLLDGGNKLAGILIDAQGEIDGPVDVCVGIGINISMRPNHESSLISQPWTSLEAIAAREGIVLPARRALAAALITEVIECIDQFLDKGFKPFVAEWACLDGLLHEDLVVTSQHQPLSFDDSASTIGTGRNEGVDEQGRLLLRNLKTGAVTAFTGGEISVRKAVARGSASGVPVVRQ